MRSCARCSDVLDGRRSDALVLLFHDPASLLGLLDLGFGQLARSKTKGAIVALSEHEEEQKGKDGLGKEIQDSVPEELQCKVVEASV